ncbi:hypothetical protein CW751_00705 [Brumimicrobium salinarum]|uniref:DUF4836 domain-containing protein n=1 Tax=Brumimicrobium salinarum TaxID=2058658 RepID=A0A2I0R5Q6_9FLAO|nr:hypothetical protein [Brumimicrobium salinarum]PKR81889.1 hypothetical protein CW751_00705 [Brumimicrobium salinarum]
MKNTLLATCFTFIFGIALGQSQYIPDSVYSVFEIDLGKFGKSVPVQELNRFEVVQSMLKELYGRSAEVNDLNQLGIDHKKKLIIYSIADDNYSSTSVVLPIKNKLDFLQLFNAEEQRLLNNDQPIVAEGTTIIIAHDVCLISDVNWKHHEFRYQAERLYEKNGWTVPNPYWSNDYYSPYKESIPDFEEPNEETIVESEEMEVVEEVPDSPEIVSDEEQLYLKRKERFDFVVDSLMNVEKADFINKQLQSISNTKNNLISNDKVFKKVSKTVADAKFYFNPIYSPDNFSSIRHKPFGNLLYNEYANLKQYAYLNFTKEGIEVDWVSRSSDHLGEALQAANDQTLNPILLDYLSKDSQGFFVYNFNTFDAYQAIKDVYLPKLEKSDDPDEAIGAAIWATVDEFINMEVLASVYPPQMLVAYGGIKEVELSKISYEYDNETFEYTEVDTTYMDRIPMLTMAISNEKSFLLEKYLNAFTKFQDPVLSHKNDYYVIKQDPYGIGFPYYIAVKEGMILISNDESVVRDNPDGFKNNSFKKSVIKNANEAKSVYGYMDFTKIYQDVQSLYDLKDDIDIISHFGDKTAKAEIQVSDIKKNEMIISLDFETNDKFDNGAYFLLEFINEIYKLDQK